MCPREATSTLATKVGLSVGLAGVVLLLALVAIETKSLRHVAIALVGLGIGAVLSLSDFGFAGSFRALLTRGDATGFRAQALAIAVASLVFFPLLALGSTAGASFSGFVTPIGISFIVGAVLFGVGMQIGGGCASGTLYALGGGDVRLAVTLAAFILGSAFGAAHLDFWAGLPAFPALTSQDLVGWPIALAVYLLIFAAIWRFAPTKQAGRHRAYWPLSVGAIGLALLNAATMLLAGRPWGETSGFTLWGSKIAAQIGFQPEQWGYWRDAPSALHVHVFADVTSIMDFGIVIGALCAAALTRRFRLCAPSGTGPWIGAVAGGMLMGYGARLSDGCNIGAYFSAMSSGSLSGWVWVLAALLGSVAGIYARRLMRMP